MTDDTTTDQHLESMIANTEAAVVERLKWVDGAIKGKLDKYAGDGAPSVKGLQRDVPELGRLYEVRALLITFFGGTVSFRARHGMLTAAEKDASVRALTN